MLFGMWVAVRGVCACGALGGASPPQTPPQRPNVARSQGLCSNKSACLLACHLVGLFACL